MYTASGSMQGFGDKMLVQDRQLLLHWLRERQTDISRQDSYMLASAEEKIGRHIRVGFPIKIDFYLWHGLWHLLCYLTGFQKHPSNVIFLKHEVIYISLSLLLDFPGSSDGKESACSVGDPSSIPELGRSPGEENDYPFQCSCLENPVDRGAWRATVHGVAKSWTWLSE